VGDLETGHRKDGKHQHQRQGTANCGYVLHRLLLRWMSAEKVCYQRSILIIRSGRPGKFRP
jgi:hypothetical protein